MKFIKRFSVLVFAILLIFIAYTLISTGYFRVIEPKFKGEIIKKIAIKGAEDIMVSGQDSFVLISATDRANESKKARRDGGLFLIDLKSGQYNPVPLTNALGIAFEPHGISFFKKDSIYHVMAINHTDEGHSIEVFELIGKNLSHKKTLRNATMIQPNDLVMIDENQFYFTNDHGYTEGLGKVMEEYLGLAVSNVIYYDGENYRAVAENIAYANGINYDKERALMFVASPRRFVIKVYAKQEDGSLLFIEDIACGTGVDNIEFDEKMNLWVAGHPSLLRFSAYRKGKKETAPSEVIKIRYQGKGDYAVEKIYVEKGHEMSGSTVAAVYGDLIFVGNVMDDEFLILKKE